MVGRLSSALLLVWATTGACGCSSAPITEENMEEIVLGGGCFWCVEAVFADLRGVLEVESGYMGGHIKRPAYREVCTGRTGHAEVVRVKFDPELLALGDLLEVFFSAHDPTTLNRQGADVGTQYRSAIFFSDSAQQPVISAAIARAQQHWEAPIVTAVQAVEAFYPAEEYHQDYYALNGEAPYCKAVIAPKLRKVQVSFSHLMEPR